VAATPRHPLLIPMLVNLIALLFSAVFMAVVLFGIACVLSIPAALIAGLYHAYKRGVLRYALLLTAAAAFVGYQAFEVSEERNAVSALPAVLGVTDMVASKDARWWSWYGERGGIRVFVLPAPVASTIAEKGLGFFEAEKLDGYKGWRETPVAPDGSWFVDFSEWGGDIRTKIVGVYTYICHRGLIYCVDVDPALIDEANAIALQRGSYYAYDGQGALIIISPAKNRVIYLYQ